jgi:hypothetical protein
VIVGSDLIYNGTPFEALSLLITKALKVGGKAYLIIPKDRYCKDIFL